MNLTVLLEKAAESFGDRAMVGSSVDGLTVDELSLAALRGAEMIVDAGATSLIFADKDGVGLAIALFAAAQAGVPLHPGGAQARSGHLSALGERAVLVGDSIDDVRVPTVVRVLSGAEWLTLTADPSRDGERSYLDPVTGDPPAVVVYTPGLVSAPKGVLLRHSHLTTYARNAALDENVAPGDAELLAVPLTEPVALTHLIRNIHVGRRSVFLDRLEPDLWLETARREHVTSALVVPPLLALIVSGGDRARIAADKAVPSLRTLEYGGAPMPASVMQKARSTWPHLNFLNEYWLAETSSTITRLTESDYQNALRSRDIFVRAQLGSVGRPLAQTHVQIRNDNDDVLEPGERGRIWVKGPHVSAEYLDSGPLLDADGFFETGDDGFVDEDGYLYLEGRHDQAIVRSGKSIAAEEVEAVVAQHPAVLDVAIIGFPGPGSDQRMIAAVVLRDNATATESELRDFAVARLHPAKVPDGIIVRNDLPRTETGKLIRRQIVEQVASDLR